MKKVLTTEIRWGRNRGLEEHTEEKANDWIGKKVRIKSALRERAPTATADPKKRYRMEDLKPSEWPKKK